jgi:hypothetical protein
MQIHPAVLNRVPASAAATGPGVDSESSLVRGRIRWRVLHFLTVRRYGRPA